MQTALSAPQSRNLKVADEANFISKINLRRVWIVANIYLRRWSRRTTERHGKLLLWIAGIAAFLGFEVAAIFDSETANALIALVAIAAMTPEFIKMSYAKIEEDEL